MSGTPHKPQKDRKRPTLEERSKIQDRVCKLLALRNHTSDIKRIVSEEFGIFPRSVEPYLCRAREMALKETGRPPEEHRADSYSYYVSVIRDEAATIREKLLAAERIDKLLGLEIKDKPKDDDGFRLNLTPDQLAEMSDEELEALRRRVAPRH